MMISLLPLLSKFKTPLLLGAAFIAAFFYGWYQHSQGYSKGFAACDAAYIAANAAADLDARKDAEDVRKKIENLDDAALDRELCSLGIVQQNSGC